ncbi:MAG: transcription elongation factor NusA [Thermofilum sp. ex4484_79]|nr:MAG: transcription elongation factor NusA [Thermofilum sp. ex4484_79]
MPVKITEEEMRYISLFESLTGVVVKDCVIDNNRGRIIFLVKEGQVGKAVGKNGINIKRLNKLIGKSIEVVEYAETLEDLIRKSLFPAKISSVKLTKTSNGRKVVIVTVPASEKGIAIGKDGKNISRARILAKRYFDVDWVTIV